MDKTQKTTRRAKREFKVIHGAEYAAFCKMRRFGVRTLDEVRGKLRNVDAAIDILKDARRELSKNTEKLQNALGVSEFFPKIKKGGKNGR